jgi:anti-sigma-K factor RskA
MTDHHQPEAGGEDLEWIEAVLRETTPADGELIEPPPDLWARIEAEVSPAAAAPIELDQRRRLAPRWAGMAVAAAVVVIAGGLGWLATRSDDASTVVAGADLAYDPASFDELGADASAHVSLIDDGGRFQVEIDQSDLPSPSGEPADLELWLIEPDAEGNPAQIVSLGLVDPASPGRFDVPEGYDPDQFSVVDISVEPRDGDAAHSGRSILRGSLTEA